MVMFPWTQLLTPLHVIFVSVKLAPNHIIDECLFTAFSLIEPLEVDRLTSVDTIYNGSGVYRCPKILNLRRLFPVRLSFIVY